MKKTALALVALLTLAGTLSAAPVTESTARLVALNFWNTYRPKEVNPVTDLQSYSYAELPHLYVFVNGDEGFVIVAADDQVRPVLGYSFDSPFPEQLHPELRYWLSNYEEQIAYAATLDGKADPRWGGLLTTEVPPTPVSLQLVPALCATRWDQGSPYNRLCPYDYNYGDQAVVGCVATAMAQIMKRWNHPSCGTGSHSYVHQNSDLDSTYGTLSADFEHTTYKWEDMPNRVLIAAAPEQEEAISTLSYHCGVAVDMMYGPHATGGSGAYSSCGWWATACAEHAFYEFFKYDTTLRHLSRSQYSDTEWLAMIDADLAAGRPMYYSGSDHTGGHAFVLDGSNTDTTYHFNWGWSGSGDGYYAMSDLSPRIGGVGGNATYTFNYGQGAIFGIQPVPEVFDTIEIYDTICNNYDTYQNHGYTLPVASGTVNLRYLDTIFILHLHVISSSTVTFSSNVGAIGAIEDHQYCSINGIEMIECPFTRNNYHFIGWSLERTGTPDTLYQPGEWLRAHGNVTLYARWKKNSAVAVDEIEVSPISLWPNPTTGEVTVTSETGHDAQVQVIDITGRVVLTESMNRSVKISLEGLPDGIYTVQVKSLEGVYNQRVIKQK